MKIQEKLQQFILEKILNNQNDLDFQTSTNLIEDGIIDSLGIMKLLTFIEESFSVQVSDDDLVPENFVTTESISTLVMDKLNAN